MSLTCKIKIHSWNGCICSKCDKTRDANHSWNGCICSKCDKTREASHCWDGCKCSKCGKIRNEYHSWKGCQCSNCGRIKDIDGSVYKTVKIGNQKWMAENLNVEHYRNGDPIPGVQDPKQWENLTSGAWCYYDNKQENGKNYGKLYNWYAVNDPRGLAMDGWHIPTLAELQTLKTTVNRDGNALKAIGQGNGTNTSGFSALLAGIRHNFNGNFEGLGGDTYFWSSTNCSPGSAFYFYLYRTDRYMHIYNIKECYGSSIRCVQD